MNADRSLTDCSRTDNRYCRMSEKEMRFSRLIVAIEAHAEGGPDRVISEAGAYG